MSTPAQPPLKPLLVVAGEASGDGHGGEILKALKERLPSLRIVGVGGPAMEPFLDRKVADIRELSVMGITEVLSALPRLRRLKRHLVQVAREEGCGAALLIDYQDFNRRLAQDLRDEASHMRLHQFVCPQVWAWNAGRIPKIGRLFDVLYCLFHFEPPLFEGLPVKALWFGNPLVDRMEPEMDRDAFYHTHSLDLTRPVVALLPGSRKSELERLMPVLTEVVRRWKGPKGHPGVQWVLPVASSLEPAWVRTFVKDLPITLVHTGSLAPRAYADAALVCSGTATLETALLGTPFALFYKLSPLTAFVGRRLVKTPFFGLANIVAGRKVVTELFQEEVTPERLTTELERLLDPVTASAMRQELSNLRAYLGEPGAARRVALHLADSLLSAPGGR